MMEACKCKRSGHVTESRVIPAFRESDVASLARSVHVRYCRGLSQKAANAAACLTLLSRPNTRPAPASVYIHNLVMAPLSSVTNKPTCYGRTSIGPVADWRRHCHNNNTSWRMSYTITLDRPGVRNGKSILNMDVILYSALLTTACWHVNFNIHKVLSAGNGMLSTDTQMVHCVL